MKDYLDGNDLNLEIILDNVYMWYSLKVKKLNDKRDTELKDFLKQMKGK